MKKKTIAIGLTLALVILNNPGKANSQSLVEGETLQNSNSAPFPTVNYKDRLKVDPEYSTGGNNGESNIVKQIIGFIAKELGAQRFLTQLHSSSPQLTGSIKTSLDFLGIPITKGKSGLPNVQEAKIVFDSDPSLNSINDIFSGRTGATYGNRDKFYQEYLTQLSEGYSNNTSLSLEGQSKSEEKVQSALFASEQSLEIAKNSEGEDTTQNIMRNISQQSALDQQVKAMQIADAQDAKVDRSLNLQMQGEILKEVSSANTRKLRESTGSSNLVLDANSLVTFPGLESAEDSGLEPFFGGR